MADETQVVNITHVWLPYFTGPGDLHIENADDKYPMLYSVKPTGNPPEADEPGHRLETRELMIRRVAAGKQLYMRYVRTNEGLSHKVVITDAT